MLSFDMDDDPSIDLTPVIDVVFMLLIFFIMTTTFSKPVLEVILPVSETSELAQAEKPDLLITVTADGKIYYGETLLESEALATLLDTLPETTLNLHIDEKAPFEAFVRVMDVARTKRGDQFLISTNQRK